MAAQRGETRLPLAQTQPNFQIAQHPNSLIKPPFGKYLCVNPFNSLGVYYLTDPSSSTSITNIGEYSTKNDPVCSRSARICKSSASISHFQGVFSCDSHAFCDARSAAGGSTASVQAPGGALAAPTRLFKGKKRPADAEVPSMPGLAAPTYLAHCACRVVKMARASARARSAA